MEQTLAGTLLEICNCMTEFALFSRRYICEPFRVQQNYLLGTFSQSNSCLLSVNLLWQCFSEVSEIFVRNLSEECPKISRPK